MKISYISLVLAASLIISLLSLTVIDAQSTDTLSFNEISALVLDDIDHIEIQNGTTGEYILLDKTAANYIFTAFYESDFKVNEQEGNNSSYSYMVLMYTDAEIYKFKYHFSIGMMFDGNMYVLEDEAKLMKMLDNIYSSSSSEVYKTPEATLPKTEIQKNISLTEWFSFESELATSIDFSKLDNSGFMRKAITNRDDMDRFFELANAAEMTLCDIPTNIERNNGLYITVHFCEFSSYAFISPDGGLDAYTLTMSRNPWSLYQTDNKAKANEILIDFWESIISEDTENNISLCVDGAVIAFPDALPFIDENARTQVPIGALAETLGIKTSWDGETKTAILIKLTSEIDGEYVKIAIGQNEIEKGNYLGMTGVGFYQTETILMDTAAILKDNRTFIPIRYVAEAFEFTVEWDGDNSCVNLSTACSLPLAPEPKVYPVSIVIGQHKSDIILDNGELHFIEDIGISPNAAPPYINPEMTTKEKWDLDAVIDYLGRDFRLSSFPDNLMAPPEGELYWSVIFNKDGTKVPYSFTFGLNYRENYYDEYNPLRPSLNVKVAKGELPFQCSLYETESKSLSFINDTEIIVGHCQLSNVTPEVYIDVYVAEFMYKDVGYHIKSENLTQEEFISVLLSIVN